MAYEITLELAIYLSQDGTWVDSYWFIGDPGQNAGYANLLLVNAIVGDFVGLDLHRKIAAILGVLVTILLGITCAGEGAEIENDAEIENLDEISISEDAEARKWKGGLFAPVGSKVRYFLDGRLIGERTWYTNGQLGEERLLRNGELHGVRRLYRQDGSRFAEIPYRKGLLDGVARFFDEQGHVISESEMKMGTGTFRTFRDLIFHLPDSEVPYVNGTPHGWARSWGKFEACEGNGVSVNRYVEGKLDAWGFVFDEDGRLVSSGFARHGKRHGVARTEKRDGTPVKGYPRYYLDGKQTDEETIRRAAERDRDLADTLNRKYKLPPAELIPAKREKLEGVDSHGATEKVP